MPATVIKPDMLKAPIMLRLLLSFAGLGVSSGVIAAPPAETDTAGRELYVEYGCWQCHGYVGQGGRPGGPAIAPEPLPFEAFVEVVRRPYGVMPAYSTNVISRSALRQIHHYLQSIEKPDVDLD